MLVIENASGSEIDYQPGSASADDIVNGRGTASWRTGVADATFPLVEGEDVFYLAFIVITWNAVADTGTVAVQDEGTTITRLTGFGWDSGFHSDESYTGGADISFKISSTSSQSYMIGLSQDPTVDRNFTSIEYAIHQTTPDVDIYESGTIKQTITSSPSIGDVCRLSYDGIDSVKYFYDGVLHRTTTGVGPGLTFFFDSSFETSGSKVTDVLFGYRSWGGTVESIEEEDALMTANTYRVLNYTAVDFDQLASKRYVAAIYENMTAGAIATDLVTVHLASEGVTVTSSTDGPLITHIPFNYAFIDEALDELAEIAGFSWKIDCNKGFTFAARSELESPFNLSSSNLDYLSIRRTQKRSTYRNVQVLKGGFQINTGLIEIIAGDANTQAFLVSELVDVVTDISTDIAGGGYTVKTFDIRGESAKDFYYQKQSHTINQDASGTVLNAADLIKITYDSKTPIIVINEDSAEITSRAAVESGSGRYEKIAVDPSIEHEDLAVDKASALLERFGSIEEIVVFQTDTAGLQAGQLISIDLTDMNCAGQYLIETVKAFTFEYNIRYAVRCLSGQAFGGWQAFFKTLENQGRSFIIRQNEVLYIGRTFRENVTVTDVATASTTSSFGFTIGSGAIMGVDTWG